MESSRLAEVVLTGWNTRPTAHGNTHNVAQDGDRLKDFLVTLQHKRYDESIHRDRQPSHLGFAA
jgi:hypothetical protein